MEDFIDAPPGFDPKPHIGRAFGEIKNYTAILIFEDGRVGSGVFVNACGFDGILTAHHVAEEILKVPEFALCVSERTATGLWVKSKNVQHLIIGKILENTERQNGPDLSFLIIRDTN